MVRASVFVFVGLLAATPVAADCARDERRIEADFRAAQGDVKRIRDGLKADRRALDRANAGTRRDLKALRELERDYRSLDGQSLSHATRKARNILNDMDRMIRKLTRAEQSALRGLRQMVPEHDRIARIGDGLLRKTDALKASCPGADVSRAARWAAKNSRDGERSRAFFKSSIAEKNERIDWLRGYADRVSRERNRVR